MTNGNCAILIWTLSIFVTLSKTDAANINLKMMSSRDHDLGFSVNITRNHDGDIIILKGKKRKLGDEQKLFVAFRLPRY